MLKSLQDVGLTMNTIFPASHKFFYVVFLPLLFFIIL